MGNGNLLEVRLYYVLVGFVVNHHIDFADVRLRLRRAFLLDVHEVRDERVWEGRDRAVRILRDSVLPRLIEGSIHYYAEVVFNAATISYKFFLPQSFLRV